MGSVVVDLPTPEDCPNHKVISPVVEIRKAVVTACCYKHPEVSTQADWRGYGIQASSTGCYSQEGVDALDARDIHVPV